MQFNISFFPQSCICDKASASTMGCIWIFPLFWREEVSRSIWIWMYLPPTSSMPSLQQEGGHEVFGHNSLDFFTSDPVEIKFLQLRVYPHIFLLSCFIFFPLCDFWLTVIAEFSHQTRVCPSKRKQVPLCRTPPPLPGSSATRNASIPFFVSGYLGLQPEFSFQIRHRRQNPLVVGGNGTLEFFNHEDK